MPEEWAAPATRARGAFEQLSVHPAAEDPLWRDCAVGQLPLCALGSSAPWGGAWHRFLPEAACDHQVAPAAYAPGLLGCRLAGLSGSCVDCCYCVMVAAAGWQLAFAWTFKRQPPACAGKLAVYLLQTHMVLGG